MTTSESCEVSVSPRPSGRFSRHSAGTDLELTNFALERSDIEQYFATAIDELPANVGDSL